jgi:hypothetical protein
MPSHPVGLTNLISNRPNPRGTVLVRAPGRERSEVIRADPRRGAGLCAARDAVTVKLMSGNDRGRHHHDAAVTGDVGFRRSRPGPVLLCRSRYNPIRRNDAGNLQCARRLERVEGQRRHRWRRRELVLHHLTKRRRTDCQANQHQ